MDATLTKVYDMIIPHLTSGTAIAVGRARRRAPRSCVIYTRNCDFACIIEAENAVFPTFDLYFDLEDGTPAQLNLATTYTVSYPLQRYIAHPNRCSRFGSTAV